MKKILNQNKNIFLAFKKLISWSSFLFSHFPWRQKERTGFHVWITEIILQQTTVKMALKKYHEFFQSFPSIEKLASSSEEEILKVWKGLGYYRRALNLHKASQVIYKKYKSFFPQEEKNIKKLQGVGDYTTEAILAIAFNKRTFAIDSNLRRVLKRLFKLSNSSDLKLKNLAKSPLFDIVFKTYSSGSINEALMDLGREICREREIKCDLCKLNNICLSRGEAIKKDIKKRKKKYSLELLRVIIVNKKKEILFYQKNENEWLSKQWELPTYTLKVNKKKFCPYPKLKYNKKELLKTMSSTITEFKIKNFIILQPQWKFLKDFQKRKFQWIGIENLKKEKTPFPIAHICQKILKNFYF